MKRLSVVSGFLVSAVVVLGVIALSWGVAAAQSSSPAPIKIGVLRAHTGFLAKDAQMKLGDELALAEVGGKVAGRPIEMIYEDTQGAPDMALTKLKKLVERDKIQIVIGPESSPEVLAVRNYVHDNKIFQVVLKAGPPEITEPGKLGSPYIFRLSYTNRTVVRVPAVYANNKGYKKAAFVTFDYVAGRQGAEEFASAFKGEVIENVFIPTTAMDVSPHLTKLAAALDRVDVVAVNLWGSIANRFLQGMGELGLSGKRPVLALGTLVPDSVESGAGNLTVGMVSVLYYSRDLQSKENQLFVKAHESRFGKKPSLESENGYSGLKVVLSALLKINGRIEDKDGFRRALRETVLELPRGKWSFDQHQSGVFPWYVLRSDRIGGEIRNVPTGETYPNVDQFWGP